jgi:hypothetical protein
MVYQFNFNIMKKLMIIVLSIIISLIYFSCTTTYKQPIGVNIQDIGIKPIDNFVRGYNYKERATINTIPELKNKNWYLARCDSGTTNFIDFPYLITVTKTTMVALKYNNGWSHVELPFHPINRHEWEDTCLYIPPGTYLFEDIPICKAIDGAGANKSKIMNVRFDDINKVEGCFWSKYSDLSFYNWCFNDYFRPVPLDIMNCNIYVEDFISKPNLYLINTGFYNRDTYYEHKFINTNLYYKQLYIAIYAEMSGHLEIINCKFEGQASHPIRINHIRGGAEISNNTVIGGITGIFVGSNRDEPIENINIFNNEVYGQSEEGISFDGFGNNWDLCPVISNGLVTNVSKDTYGNLIIQANFKEVNGTGEITTDLKSRDNTKYYFAFEEGSGIEGTICEILSQTDSTVTVDYKSDSVKIGGLVGINAGFFNCTIKNNIIHDVIGNNYGTGLSIYLNVFNINVEGNKIYNCWNGLNLAGGQMLTTYHTLAYNNTINNNEFSDCNGGIWVQSYWGGEGAKKQYGNKFINNDVIRTNITIHRQYDFTYENNRLNNSNIVFQNMN